MGPDPDKSHSDSQHCKNGGFGRLRFCNTAEKSEHVVEINPWVSIGIDNQGLISTMVIYFFDGLLYYLFVSHIKIYVTLYPAVQVTYTPRLLSIDLKGGDSCCGRC